MSKEIKIGDRSLSIEDIFAVSLEHCPVELASQAREKMMQSYQMVERALEDSSIPFYGINTGFGSLKDVHIPLKDLSKLQVNFIRSHAVGMGAPLPISTARTMMLLRAHMLALGHSGVRPQVVEMLCKMLDLDVVPVIPCQGSVGASGDLAPLAHLALGMLGEGEAYFKGTKMKAKQALDEAEILPLSPVPREALALVNGTQMMCAVGLAVLKRVENSLKHADLVAAMTLEASLGSPKAYDKRIHELRFHPGQKDSATNLRLLTSESEIQESHQDCSRVQDAYSIRCVPQVHGAARDMLQYVRSVLEKEINSVTDNPILFPASKEIISAGNFHGQPIALALDSLAIALTSVASISERRSFRLLDFDLSELPNGLIKNPGLNSGLYMLQVLAASLVNECKTYAHPASVDSIPTWSDQEDHVSMGAFAARKSEQVVDCLEKILAVEMICSAQGLGFRKPLRPAKGVGIAYKEIRKVIEAIETDRYLKPDLDAALQLIQEGKLLKAIENSLGKLA